jgi:hypothetical protein
MIHEKYMAHWKRRIHEQEQEVGYFFNGNFYCTRTVSEELTEAEIILIYLDAKNFVQVNNGIDYLQIYEDENNRTLYFIDNLSSEQMASGCYSAEDNYCTLLFSNEY